MRTPRPKIASSAWLRGRPRSKLARVCALALLLGCAGGTRPYVFQAPPWNTGPEPYSAWFGDARDGVLYFGLSPFWTLWWAEQGDPHADLREPGDHLIGRFDLEAGTFLAPLRVRSARDGARGSVWDVLAHSNGRVYYTTFFEEFGWVDPASGESGVFAGLGSGFNELWEGPQGRVYVTRYSDAPRGAPEQRYGAVLALEPDGRRVFETRFSSGDGAVTAPKSIAVDPDDGHVWINADVISPAGDVSFAWLHLDERGRVLERGSEPELLFVSFDPAGRGWFVEDERGRLRVRIVEAPGEELHVDLGPRVRLDFAQDLHFAADGSALIAFWSGRVAVIGPDGSRREQVVERPTRCVPPAGRAIVYSAIAWEGAIYATVFCGATISRAPWPESGSEATTASGPGAR